MKFVIKPYEDWIRDRYPSNADEHLAGKDTWKSEEFREKKIRYEAEEKLIQLREVDEQGRYGICELEQEARLWQEHPHLRKRPGSMLVFANRAERLAMRILYFKNGEGMSLAHAEPVR